MKQNQIQIIFLQIPLLTLVDSGGKTSFVRQESNKRALKGQLPGRQELHRAVDEADTAFKQELKAKEEKSKLP